MLKKIERREFLQKSSLAVMGAVALSAPVRHVHAEQKADEIMTARQYLNEILYTKEEVDKWLAGKAFPFAKYHSEFGWLLNNGLVRDGVDNSLCQYTFTGEDGERIMNNYKEKPCRINTYGDSFTQCHQVSDLETWQEVLAAHLQEPVRNFGIGGWSVYQAYLRMLKEEKRTPSEYIIFNIYDDDHRRNLDSWRNIRRRKHVKFIEPTLPYVKVNLKEQSFIECANPCPTPESVYKLCDPDPTVDMFKDDFVLQILLAHKNAKSQNPYKSYSNIMELATTHGIETEIENNETLAQTAEDLHIKAALFASEKIVEKIENFAQQHNKKVLYVLSFPPNSVARYLQEGKRWDQPFADFLKKKNLPVVDLLEAHKKDYSAFNIDIKTYLNRYYIGHYNPTGNHFCAFALKEKLVEMLDPKPVPYRAGE